MRDRPEAPKVEIPPVRFQRQPHLDDAPLEDVVALLALRAADDLPDARGENVSDPRIAVHAVGLEKMADRAEGALAEGSGEPPDADFHYDAALAGYVYRLSTQGLARGTWKLALAVDGVAHGTYRVNLALR